MRQQHGLLIVLLFCVFWSFQSFAAGVNGEKPESQFDLEKANNEFDKISIRLSTENLNPQTLNDAAERLDELAKKADECVKESSSKIREIDSKMKQFFGDNEKTAGRVDSTYLKNQKIEMTQKQSECRLFLIRANEALDAYRKTALSIQQEITFTRGKNILQRLYQFPDDVQAISLPVMDQAEMQRVVKCTFYALPMFIIALFASWRLNRLLHKKPRRHIRLFLLNSVLIFLSFFFAGNLLFSPNPFLDADLNVLFQAIIKVALFYTVVLFAYNLLFNVRRLSSMLQWYGFDVVFLKRLGKTVLTIYCARLIGIDVLQLLQASDNLIQLFEDSMLIVSISAMIYFILILYHTHSEWFKKHFSGVLLYQSIVVIVLALLTFDFIGYSILAVSAAYILFSFLLLSALGTVLFLGITNAYSLISYNPHYLFHLKKIFGYSGEPPFIELLLLKIIAQLVLVITFLFVFAQLIGEASYFFDGFFDYLVHGFKVGGVLIAPLQWLIGAIAFCLLSLFSRHIATKISQSQQYDEEEEKQVAFAAIFLYAGFAISVIFGLLFAGFSFTSLAIIAGALSVGIGLGMQSIVNNFFSGLILLIEKPIKAGDRIKIDDVEGFVKKVSVRSTQIVTPSQEDVIIPNSDLITHQVTNYMFTDKFWRVKCALGVAYGSDTEKVSRILTEVAMSHPEVVKHAPNKPMVLFRSFGDSALMFELWCLIKDVNQKFVVTSELNFALDKACRENDITIAFPQRDVHVTFDKDTLPWPVNPDK